MFVLFIFMIASVGSASAESLTVLNHSFEEPDASVDGMLVMCAVPGWYRYYVSGVVNRSGTNPYATRISAMPDGTDQAGFGNSNSGFIQNLTATLEANTEYTFMVDVGLPTELTFAGASINLASTGDGGVTVDYLTAETESLVAPAVGEWSTWVKTFVTGATPVGLGNQLRIELCSNPSDQVLFDNVRLSAVAVPEPSTIVALIGMLSIGLMGLRRKRCNK